jgi:hypothetical protein
MARTERVRVNTAFLDAGTTGTPRPCTLWRPRGAVALLGVLLAIGGCGDSSATSQEPTASDLPVIPSAAGPPGTSLGDGFTVVDGTVLIGDPIPIGVAVVYEGQPIVDDGWTATAILTGADPIGIVDAYMRQAAEAGLVEQPGTGCIRDLDVAICSAFARSADAAEPRSLSATVVRGEREDVISDHVIVRFSTTEFYWSTEVPVRGAGDRDLDGPASTA